ncbi:uncharacterized protein METZ01_LOCUS239773, partial [marine metagenome]
TVIKNSGGFTQSLLPSLIEHLSGNIEKIW